MNKEKTSFAASELKRLREASGLSVRKLAKAIGMQPSTYASYENRYKKRLLPVDFARQVAGVLADHGIEKSKVLALADASGACLDAAQELRTLSNPLILQNQINQEVGRRLTAARKNQKLTIAGLAKKADVAIDVLERCEHGELPTNDILRHLEDVLDAPLIIEGEARSFHDDDLGQFSRGQMIDEHDARGGMGDGERPDHDNPIATWMVPGGHFGRGDLVIMGSRGNSMEPTLLSGDRVVVDRADRDASHGGIFVIRDNESSKIKRIETVTGSKPRRLRILSENPLHQPEEIDLADDLIIGRVVGLIRRF